MRGKSSKGGVDGYETRKAEKEALIARGGMHTVDGSGRKGGKKYRGIIRGLLDG